MHVYIWDMCLVYNAKLNTMLESKALTNIAKDWTDVFISQLSPLDL